MLELPRLEAAMNATLGRLKSGLSGIFMPTRQHFNLRQRAAIFP